MPQMSEEELNAILNGSKEGSHALDDRELARKIARADLNAASSGEIDAALAGLEQPKVDVTAEQVAEFRGKMKAAVDTYVRNELAPFETFELAIDASALEAIMLEAPRRAGALMGKAAASLYASEKAVAEIHEMAKKAIDIRLRELSLDVDSRQGSNIDQTLRNLTLI